MSDVTDIVDVFSSVLDLYFDSTPKDSFKDWFPDDFIRFLTDFDYGRLSENISKLTDSHKSETIKSISNKHGKQSEVVVHTLLNHLQKDLGPAGKPSSSLTSQTITPAISLTETAIWRSESLSSASSQVSQAEWPQIEGYDIIRQLSSGAQADIFLCERLNSHRRSVLKCLKRTHLNAQRAHIEKDALAKISSPCVTEIYAYGDLPNHALYDTWLEIEYCALGHLGVHLKSAVDEVRRLRWVYQLSQAILAIHRSGYAHLDLKPANLLIDRHGALKVSDFGISRQISADSRGTLTAEGGLVGTLAYMSPEQLRGEYANQGSDVWAFGVILYEMFTRAPLIQALNIAQLSQRVLNGDFSLEHASIPDPVLRVIQRCVRLDSSERYESFEACWSELSRYVEPLLVQAHFKTDGLFWAELSSLSAEMLHFLETDLAADEAPALQFIKKHLKHQRNQFIFPYEELNHLLLEAKERFAGSRGTKEERARWLEGELKRRARPVSHWNARLRADGSLAPRALAPYQIQQSIFKVQYSMEQMTKTLTHEVVRKKKKFFFFTSEYTAQVEREERRLVPHVSVTAQGSFPLSYCPPGQVQLTDEVAQPFTVQLAEGFWLMSTPVTQGIWSTLMPSNPSAVQGEQLPVTNITWLESVVFANRLSEREGLTPAYELTGDQVLWVEGASGYRLPTEVMWLYAARAGQSHLYAGSSDLSEVAWSRLDQVTEVQPVARKRPNAWGLYDMTGNVSEWCADSYQLIQDRALKTCLDSHHKFWVSDLRAPRVSRGGGWDTNERGCELSKRLKRDADCRLGYLGVRLAVPCLRGLI